MRYQHDGITIWYGTEDTPAPEGAIAINTETPITIGVQPLDPSNRVEVRYRVNGENYGAIAAKPIRSVPTRRIQYFRGVFPLFQPGDRIEYNVICRCAGRQVPETTNADTWATSFTVGETSNTRLVDNPILDEPIVTPIQATPVRDTVPSSQPTIPVDRESDIESDRFTTQEVIGQLIDDRTNKPLAGYSVRGSIQIDREQENLGYEISNGRGYFSFTYTLPENRARRSPSRLSLEILNSDEESIYQTTVTIPANPEQIVEVRVPLTQAPEPDSPALTQVANISRTQLPAQLLSTLANKGIQTLADLRQAGGINNIPELATAVDNPALQKLEAQANLSIISDDLQLNTALIDRGFTSIDRIARVPSADFVSAIGDIKGDFSAAQLQVKARAQTNFLNNIVAGMRADLANGLPNPLIDRANIDDDVPAPPSDDVFNPTCSCLDCEAATSPIAYLADLIDYAIAKVENNNSAIDFKYLDRTFHQPFSQLPTSCEIQQQEERQVRFCIEVLRSYLRVNFPTTEAQTLLEMAEKKYRLEAYLILLNQLGTSYDELRQTRGNETEQQDLASRLGIALDKLDRLFLDPDAEASTAKAITEETLERIFRLKATNRDPLGTANKLGDSLNQVVDWDFQGIVFGENTDANGWVYLNLDLIRGIAGYVWTVAIFKDRDRTQLVAQGSTPPPTAPESSLRPGNPSDRFQGTIALTSVSNSGLTGSVTLDFQVNSNTIEINTVIDLEGLLEWRLQYLRTLWQQEDWAEDIPQDVPPIDGTSPIIDPDLIGLAYLKNWSNPDDPAYQLWQARTDWIEEKLNELRTSPRDFAGFKATVGARRIRLLELLNAQERGEDITQKLKDASLSRGAFLYLIRIRNLLAQDNPVLSSEWEEVYNILLQVQKIREYPTWREQERNNQVILSPESFQIPAPPALEFPPPEPQPLTKWRASQQALRTWEDKLQSRIDREEAIAQGLQIAVSSTEEATLTILRDALITALNLNDANSFDAKADWVTKNLLIDARADSCQLTTRIAQAIEIIQGLLWGLKNNQFRDIYPNLELGDRTNFDEKWKWLGSYATWRSAMLVFLYPENILRPELRKYQTPAFRQLVQNVRNNRRLTPERACQAAQTYSDYLADIDTLEVQATCQTRTRIYSGDCRDRSSKSYSNLFHMFAIAGKTGKVYWSSNNPSDTSEYSQTFWIPLLGIEKAINIIGAIPYQISSAERYIYLFIRTQKDDAQELVYLRYDLENSNWDKDPKNLELPEDAKVFTAVVKQSHIETNPPHLAIRLNNSVIYARRLNRTGNDWEGGSWRQLINPDISTLFIKICSMVEIDNGQWFLVVQKSNRQLACKLFGSGRPTNWLNIGNSNSSFRGAFSFNKIYFNPDYYLYIYWKNRANIYYQAIKTKTSPSEPEIISSLLQLNNWLSSNADIELEKWDFSTIDFPGLPEAYKDQNLSAVLSYTASTNPAPEVFNFTVYSGIVNNIISSLSNFTEWQRANTLFQASTVENLSLFDSLEDFALCGYNGTSSNGTPNPVCPRIEILNSQPKSNKIISNFGDILIAPTAGSERIVIDIPRSLTSLNNSNESSSSLEPIKLGAKQLAYEQLDKQLGLYRAFFQGYNNDNDRLNRVSSKHIAPQISGLYNIPEQISESELHTRREEIREIYEENSPISSTNRAYLDEAYYFVPIFLALHLQQQRYYQEALNYYRTVYAYNLTIDNSRSTEPKDQLKIYYGLKLEESLPEVYQRAEDWLLDPLNPHLIAASRRNTYTRFTLLSIVRCFLEYADDEFTRDTAESVPRARTLYLTAIELLNRLEQQEQGCKKFIDALDTEISDLLEINAPELLPVWDRIKDNLLQIKDEQILKDVVREIETVIASEETWKNKLTTAQNIIDRAIVSLPKPPNLERLLQQNRQKSNQIYAALLARPKVSNAIRKVTNVAGKDYLHAVSIVSGVTTQALETEKINLPWLRQKNISIPINESSTSATAISQSNLRADYQRLTKYNPIAPTRIATLAQIAKTYPLQAVQIVQQQPNSFVPSPIYGFCIPLNPVLDALRLWGELNLYKLRTCRNIAGIERELDPYAAPTDILSGLPQIGAGGQLVLPGSISFPATPYRYTVLIDRAKQLVSIAQQIEASFLSALEKLDGELYQLLKARQDIQLTRAGVRLQDLRVREAESGVTLAELQRERSQIQVDHYENLLDEGLIFYEQASIASMIASAAFSTIAAAIYGTESAKETVKLIVSLGFWGNPGQQAASGFSALASAASTTASLLSQLASYERREQEWRFQEKLAQQDVRIGTQQIRIAQDRVRVVGQERVISQMQADFAEETLDFLSTKFTNVDFYDWMVGILEGVYSFFLQQATATAKLAENQLAFERQQVPPAYIQADYWEIPNDNLGGATQDSNTTDRRGITGSARLLQDIYQLDQYAFETDQRKLQLTKTISLARLAPAEFQGFRETGVMLFSTPMELFDRDFPGHYLRLIKRVRASIIALIPPNEGIKATLSTTGVSRVVIGQNNLFQTNDIPRPPEFVALTSPRDATGLFELTPQSQEMLLPFENLGVDTSWELRLPKASNLFDYSTIADVLITIEYTALNSFTYRQQVIQDLGNIITGDRPFSFRNQFADAWYDLNNPEQTDNPMVVAFETTREDFPANIKDLKIQQLVLYFARSKGEIFEVSVETLDFTYIEENNDETTIEGNGNNTTDGVISTRRGNAPSGWGLIIQNAPSPSGKWKLALPYTDEIKTLFEEEAIEDILFVITYSGRIIQY